MGEVGGWVGVFKKNKRHKKGIYIDENGDKYDGEFKDNKKNGKFRELG